MLELEGHENVTILSDSVASYLFPFMSPIGRNIRVGSDYYKVIGVAESEQGVGQAAAARLPTGRDMRRVSTSPLLPQKAGLAKPSFAAVQAPLKRNGWNCTRPLYRWRMLKMLKKPPWLLTAFFRSSTSRKTLK